MAQAKKTKAGTWTILVYSHTETIDGKEKRIYERFTADKKSEVVRMAEDFKANRKGQTTILTVEQALQNYIDMKRNILSPATLRGYINIHKNRFPTIRNIPINKLTNKEIQAEVNIEATRYAPKTLRNTYGVLSTILGVYAPYFQLRISYPANAAEEIVIPTEQEIKLLLDHCKSFQLSLAMKIAFGMGLRRSEICALKVSDIDFYKNQIKVQRAMVKTPEKKWILKTPKTKAGKRTLSIPDFLIPDLKQAVQVKEPNDLIFSLNPENVSNRYMRLVAKIGINHITFHALRHYHASMMLANNVPSKYAMKRMGHESDMMLKRVYQHTMENKEKEVTQTINTYLSNAFLQ